MIDAIDARLKEVESGVIAHQYPKSTFIRRTSRSNR